VTIAELVPDPDALLALESEELGGVVLQYLAANAHAQRPGAGVAETS
jgi:hypothetical protein